MGAIIKYFCALEGFMLHVIWMEFNEGHCLEYQHVGRMKYFEIWWRWKMGAVTFKEGYDLEGKNFVRKIFTSSKIMAYQLFPPLPPPPQEKDAL